MSTIKQLSWGGFMLIVMILTIELEGRWSCDGCLEDERNALFQVKNSFLNNVSVYDDVYFILVDWGKSGNCCNWDGVVCSSDTGRITELHLKSSKYWDSKSVWYLNASLFLPFQQLHSLSLVGNKFAGCIQNGGFERLSTLENLKFLNLGYNNFTNNILSSIAALPSLIFLSLYGNRLKGILSIDELNNLTNLTELHMEANAIEGFISLHDGDKLLKLRNLEYLYLSNNQLKTNSLSFLKGLSSLKCLGLEYNQFKGPLHLKELQPFSKLQELRLSGNEIEKFINSSTDFNGPSNLSVIYLEDMNTNRKGTLLQSLGVFSCLKTLYLERNNFKGKIFDEEPYHVNKVEELYLDESSLDEDFLRSLSTTFPSLKLLSMTYLNGALPVPDQGLPMLRNLEHLYLNESTLNNTFLQSIGKMTSLKTLSLEGSGLTGTIPSTHGFCELKFLQALSLSGNNLSGNLPWCTANLTSLQILDLSNNHFNGSISPLSTLTSTYDLKLSYNMFKVPISLNPLFNLSKLTNFECVDCQIFAETEELDMNMTPKFQLKTLYLSGGNENYDGAIFPKFLYHQHQLEDVDLSNNKLRGRFPYWLLDNNTNLNTLYLANTSLSGPIQLPIHHHMNLSNLDISDNSFRGSIPTLIGIHLPRLMFLRMSNCGFDGTIPSSFGNISSLEDLDLSNNSLQGGILESLSNCSFLKLLDLSHNSISGTIPDWLGNMTNLSILDLSNNTISGSLASNCRLFSLSEVHLSRNRIQGSLNNTFFSCSYQFILMDIGHNQMTGSIPSWIGGLSQLGYLLLSHNNFEGEIPIQLCNLNMLSFVDLSYNHLYGHIVPCLRCRSIADRAFYYSQNFLSSIMEGNLELTMKSIAYSYKGSIATYIVGIDFSCNNFTGSIPHEFGNHNEILLLNLSHNCLTGPIPTTFSNLSQLESLDLSYNNLQGSIPLELTKLTFLAKFNVSYNNLSGSIPERLAQFITFDESSYLGNPFLYGCPLPKNCSTRKMPPPLSTTPTHDNSESGGFIDMEVFYVSFGVAYVMVLLAMVAVLYINPYWRRVWFYYVELSMENYYYFIIDNLAFLSRLFSTFTVT